MPAQIRIGRMRACQEGPCHDEKSGYDNKKKSPVGFQDIT